MGKSQFEQDMAKWPRSLKSRVSLDKEYEFVSRQVDANNARIWDAFKLYVQVMTVVVGGAVYAALTFKIDPKTREVLALLTSGMVFLITAVTIGIVLDCLRSWKGYRQAQCRLAGLRLDGQPHIDAPHVGRLMTNWILILAVAVLMVAFICYNPVGLISQTSPAPFCE